MTPLRKLILDIVVPVWMCTGKCGGMMIIRIGYDFMNIIGNTIERCTGKSGNSVKAGDAVVIARAGIGSTCGALQRAS